MSIVYRETTTLRCTVCAEIVRKELAGRLLCCACGERPTKSAGYNYELIYLDGKPQGGVVAYFFTDAPVEVVRTEPVCLPPLADSCAGR